MKIILAAPIVLSLLLCAGPVWAQGVPAGQIAFVSSQRISAESAEGKAGVARVQALQQQKTAEVRAKQQALEATRLQLVRTADAAARLPLQLQEQQQRVDFERAVAQSQAEIQSLQRQVNAEVLGKVKAVLDEILKESEIKVVLNVETAVVWAAPGLDLTPAVLERLKAKSAVN